MLPSARVIVSHSNSILNVYLLHGDIKNTYLIQIYLAFRSFNIVAEF